MSQATYDAVIVGGRCAGASLATYLAREGASVALLEAGPRGSDQVLSTHTIHPPGMDVLDELGVGAAVRKRCPPARVLRLEVDGVHVDVTPAEGRHECCPRRQRLDSLLQDVAESAGVEFFEKTRVVDLIRDGDRVVGVHAKSGDRSVEFRGQVVVGADGRHSTIAELAGAEEYLGYDWPRVGYWAYWEPPSDWSGPDYPYDFLLRFTGTDRRLIFATDDGQVLLGTMPVAGDRDRWRQDHETKYLEDLQNDRVFAPLVAKGRRASPVVGTVRERFFFRRSAGPGWALVGDAGHHKDPLIGWGIAEALVQAKHLAKAIREGTDLALERYWRQRDVDALPRFRYAEERGEPSPMNPVMRTALRRVPAVPGLAQHMFREAEYEVNPYELMPIGKIVRWTLSDALRGRPELILDFLRQGRRASGVQRELAHYRKILNEVRERA